MATSSVVARVKASYVYFWDVSGQQWVAGQQPILNAGSVTIPGTVTVSDGGASLSVDSTPTALNAASGDVSTAGNTTLITPTSGKRLRIIYVSYSPSDIATVGFRFGSTGPLWLRNTITVGGTIIAKNFGDFYCMEGAINEPLVLNQSAAVTTAWNVFYTEI